MGIELKAVRARDKWREIRDAAFNEAGINGKEIYKKGEFDKLPPNCLKAVCYVDAYNCVLGWIDNLKEPSNHANNKS